jgi:hypothetical protein
MQIQFGEQQLVYAAGAVAAAVAGVVVRFLYRRLREATVSEVAKGWAVLAASVGLVGFGGTNVSDNVLPKPPEFKEGTPPEAVALKTAHFQQHVEDLRGSTLMPMWAALPLLAVGIVGVFGGVVKLATGYDRAAADTTDAGEVLAQIGKLAERVKSVEDEIAGTDEAAGEVEDEVGALKEAVIELRKQVEKVLAPIYYHPPAGVRDAATWSSYKAAPIDHK